MKTKQTKSVKKHDSRFNRLMLNRINTFSGDTYYERLEIYTYVSRVLKSMGSFKIYHELMYRLEEGENLNTILIDLMEKDEELSNHLYNIRLHIQEFEYFDEFIKYFQ